MRAEHLLSLFVLLAAALMFTLELLAGRLLLPTFGGTFSVWATCLAFFQGALRVGYAGCLALARLPKGVHVALLIADGIIQTEQAPKADRPPAESLGAEDVAAAVVYLAAQRPRAWTHELTLTPAMEHWVP